MAKLLALFKRLGKSQVTHLPTPKPRFQVLSHNGIVVHETDDHADAEKARAYFKGTTKDTWLNGSNFY